MGSERFWRDAGRIKRFPACRPLRLEPPRSKNWQIVTVDYFNPAATLIFK
jgi:hypothetical protein